MQHNSDVIFLFKINYLFPQLTISSEIPVPAMAMSIMALFRFYSSHIILLAIVDAIIQNIVEI